MTDVQRAQIRMVVDHFAKNPVTQDALNELCNKNGVELFDIGFLDDYTEQVEHDKRVTALLADITPLLQRIKYVPEFAPAKERQEAIKANNDLEDDIAKLFETHGIKYKFLSGAKDDIASMLRSTIDSAGNMIFNKASAVILDITREKFGEDLNTKHVREYVEKKHSDKKNK